MNYLSIFKYYVESIDPNLGQFPVQVIIKLDGFADDKIGNCQEELIDMLYKYII